MATQIFPHQNTQSLSVTYYDGTPGFVSGLCCGYSIAWAKLFLLGKDLADTVPKQATARSLTSVMSAHAYRDIDSTMDMVAKAAVFHGLKVVHRHTPRLGWDLVMLELAELERSARIRGDARADRLTLVVDAFLAAG